MNVRRNLYQRWYRMHQRCKNVNDTHYKNYGGRGIKVDPVFDNFDYFYDYITKLSDYSLSLSIDRVDNDGDYTPGNLRWADPTTQRINQQQKLVRKPHKYQVNNKTGVIGLTYNKSKNQWMYVVKSFGITYRKCSKHLEVVADFIADLAVKG